MSQTYAKIGRSIVGTDMPMHWHEPYNYWQWAFEAHTKDEGSHSLHDVENPIWVGPKVTNPTKPGVATYTPSAEEVAWYNETLDATSAASLAIKAAYKEYLKNHTRRGAVAVVVTPKPPVAPDPFALEADARVAAQVEADALAAGFSH